MVITALEIRTVLLILTAVHGLTELIIFEMWDVYSVMLASWPKVSFLNTIAPHHINWLCRFMNGFENTVSIYMHMCKEINLSACVVLIFLSVC